LHALARQKTRQRSAGQTLEASALVHEAFIRLVDQTHGRHWDGRWHFFEAAAEAMRRILVDRARRRGRLKRGSGRQRISLDDLELTVQDPPDELITLDEALAGLEEVYPQKAQLVKLRYFAGLTIEEAAEGHRV
jgi:RNA polymerase sigma factor (TIGR02999 family)